MTRAIAIAGLLSLLAATAQAQLPQTRLYAVFPPGMQVGATTEVTVTGGEDIDELKALHFTHPGLSAVPKMQTVDGQQQPVDNVFVVSAASNLPPGVYEVVAEGRFGASNPRRFSVGVQPETNEAEPNNDAAAATALAINSVVNARMDGATDVDWFKFNAESGQRLVIDCAALSIDSRMSVTLELYDPAGRRIRHARSTHIADAALAFDASSAGEYKLKVFDYTFRGGSEYFYRLAVHTSPRIAFALPAAGLPGTSTPCTLYGYNLPGGARTDIVLDGVPLESLATRIALPSDPALLDADDYHSSVAADVDTLSFHLPSPLGPSNAVRIGLAGAPVILEQEPNNEPAQSQVIAAPVEITGQFATKGDIDYFAFDAKANEVWCLETFGERIGSSADPYLIVEQVTKDDKGVETVKRLTAQDDTATNLYQNVFDTQTDDAYFRLQAPADGTYRVSVRHRAWETEGNPALVYRLAIRRETPDFRVVAVPLSPTPGQPFPVGLRHFDHFAVNLLAFRRDGFTGPIAVSAGDLPPGITTDGAVIGPGQTTATLTFTAANGAAAGTYRIPLTATTTLPNAAAVAAVEAAKGAVASANAAVAPLKAALETANKNVQLTTAARDAAKAAAAAKADDVTIAQAAQLTQQGLDSSVAVQAAAAAAVAEAEKKAAEAVAAQQQAEQAAVAQARQVSRTVRAGMVVWAGAQNVPATSRVASAVCVSVMPEVAAFEVNTGVSKVVLHQGGQALIPATLEKRNGFDDAVTLTFSGLPGNTNIDLGNSKFEKGETAKLLRIFAKENAAPGIYTLWLATQGQVSYARNPERAARLKTEADSVTAQAKAAADAATAATAAKTDAVAKAAAAAAVLKQATDEKATADAAAQTSSSALTQATDAKKAADQKSTDAQAAKAKADQSLAMSQQVLSNSDKVVQMATELVKSAQAALDTDPNSESLKKQKADSDAALAAAQKAKESSQAGVAAAEQSVATVKAQVEQTAAAAAESEKALAAATEASKQAEATAKQKQEAFATAESANKAAAEAQAAAEKAEQAATAASTAAEAKRAAAAKAAEEAAKAAAPQNKSFTPPSATILVEVRAAPIKLAANVPDSGNLKRGASLQIKVTATRQNGFAGPITVSLKLPPGVAGLSSDSQVIAADKTEAVLTVAAAADAPAGAVANLVVQGSMEFAGAATVDVPVTITVTE
ncbi:MAG: PPC domain-containing protein [Planctomycetaceae bacterium]